MRFWIAAILGIALSSSAVQAEPPPTFVRSWGHFGNSPGEMKVPSGVAIDDSGFIYVAELWGQRIHKFDRLGHSIDFWGSEGAGPGQFHEPNDLAFDWRGRLWVVDALNYRVQWFDRAGTPLGAFGTSGKGSGQFYVPNGIAVHGDYLYVADTWNYRIQKFLLPDETAGAEPQWVMSLGDSGSGDGQFNAPRDVEISDQSEMYVVDSRNNRVSVFTENGQFLRNLYGPRTLPDVVPRSGLFRQPTSIAIDAAGMLYVVDTFGARVQKLTPQGSLIVWWGPGSGKGDTLRFPIRMAIDRQGLLYIGDADPSRFNDRIAVFEPYTTSVATRSLTQIRELYRGR